MCCDVVKAMIRSTFKTRLGHHSVNFMELFCTEKTKMNKSKNSALKTMESNDRTLNLESTKQDRRKIASLLNF